MRWKRAALTQSQARRRSLASSGTALAEDIGDGDVTNYRHVVASYPSGALRWRGYRPDWG
jgi:hypothetical protein